MIAVYYYTDSAPYTMLAIDVKEATLKSLQEALQANEQYPDPSADVMFIENEKIINVIMFESFHRTYDYEKNSNN